MNRTIKLLMLSEVFILTGFGLMEPILAIFFKENLVGGSIVTAAIASTLFLITKSFVQLPFSKYVDNHKDKIKWLHIGTFLIILTPVLYIFSNHIYHIYVAQIIYGIGSGLAYPTWLGIWTLHLDKNHESFEWSLYSTLVGISTAIAGIIGAEIAQNFGFNWTFVYVGIISFFGFLILLFLEKEEEKLRKINQQAYHHHYHHKRKMTDNKKHR